VGALGFFFQLFIFFHDEGRPKKNIYTLAKTARTPIETGFVRLAWRGPARLKCFVPLACASRTKPKTPRGGGSFSAKSRGRGVE